MKKIFGVLLLSPVLCLASWHYEAKSINRYIADVREHFDREVKAGRTDPNNFAIFRYALEKFDSSYDLKLKCLNLPYYKIDEKCVTHKNSEDSVQTALDAYEYLQKNQPEEKAFKDPSDGATGTSSSSRAGDMFKGALMGEGVKQLSKIADTARDYYTERFLDSVRTTEKKEDEHRCRSSRTENCTQ